MFGTSAMTGRAIIAMCATAIERPRAIRAVLAARFGGMVIGHAP
jgi:hypothetical protein